MFGDFNSDFLFLLGWENLGLKMISGVGIYTGFPGQKVIDVFLVNSLVIWFVNASQIFFYDGPLKWIGLWLLHQKLSIMFIE